MESVYYTDAMLCNMTFIPSLAYSVWHLRLSIWHLKSETDADEVAWQWPKGILGQMRWQCPKGSRTVDIPEFLTLRFPRESGMH